MAQHVDQPGCRPEDGPIGCLRSELQCSSTCMVVFMEHSQSVTDSLTVQVCMFPEIDEEPFADVSILCDTGSAATVCPHAFQEELGTRTENGGPRCEAATRTSVLVQNCGCHQTNRVG